MGRQKEQTINKRNDKTSLPLRKQHNIKQGKFYANRYIHIMVWITLIYFLIFRYWPLVWISIAFKDFKILKGYFDSDWVGFYNFKHIFKNMPYFWKLIRNTFALNGLSILFAFPAPIIFAILLNEIRLSYFKRTVQTVSYLPHFLSTVVVVGIVRTFLSPSLGALNKLIADLGAEKINFLQIPAYFWGLMVIVGIWQSVGWSAIIYLSAILSIDPSLYEAAEIDGAGRWKKIYHVTLPGIRSTIIILLILRIGSMMSVDTEKIYLFQNNVNLGVSEMFPTLTYKIGLVNNEPSRAAAYGLFSSIISLIFVLGANKVSKKYSEISII